MIIVKQKKFHICHILILTVNIDGLYQTLHYGGFEYVEDVSMYFDIYFNYFEKNQFGQFGMW